VTLGLRKKESRQQSGHRGAGKNQGVMSKHPKPPIPIDHWFKDLASVESLRDVLDNAAFKQAVAILKEIGGPSFGTLQDNDTNSLRHAWYAGYRDAFNDLQKLTKLPVNENKNIQPDEWLHIEQ